MITEFKITADTGAMIVKLEISQAGQLVSTQIFNTVQDAAMTLVQSIDKVLDIYDRPPWED